MAFWLSTSFANSSLTLDQTQRHLSSPANASQLGTDQPLTVSLLHLAKLVPSLLSVSSVLSELVGPSQMLRVLLLPHGLTTSWKFSRSSCCAVFSLLS